LLCLYQFRWCISSTGIKYDHEEFQRRAISSYDPIDKFFGTNQRGRDCNGHGTHVAGLVAGKTFGVAKKALVFSVRVLGCNGKSSNSIIIDGIYHVIRTKQRNRSRKIIINMSITGFKSEAVLRAVKAATDEGILVVAAAGNNFRDACRYVLSTYYLSVHKFFYTSTLINNRYWIGNI